jgi:hypothetical protein
MDRAGLLASRVRMSSIRIRPRPSRNVPVAEGNVLAYSCAAARELHPLPCLRRAAKTRFPRMTKSVATESRVMGSGGEVKWGSCVLKNSSDGCVGDRVTYVNFFGDAA